MGGDEQQARRDRELQDAQGQGHAAVPGPGEVPQPEDADGDSNDRYGDAYPVGRDEQPLHSLEEGGEVSDDRGERPRRGPRRPGSLLSQPLAYPRDDPQGPAEEQHPGRVREPGQCRILRPAALRKFRRGHATLVILLIGTGIVSAPGGQALLLVLGYGGFGVGERVKDALNGLVVGAVGYLPQPPR